MRQAKQKPKETPKEKKDRKKEFKECREKVPTVVLPAILVVAMLIIIFVYFKTRPPSVAPPTDL